MRPSKAIFDLNKLKVNFARIKTIVGDRVEIFPVVKANAYGHGALPVALTLEKNFEIKNFCVANLEEALELKKAGIKGGMIILGGVIPGEEEEIIQNGFKPVVSQEQEIDRLSSIAKKLEKKVTVHLKIDTGMGRIGCLAEELKSFISTLESCEMVEVEGVMSHFSSASLLDKDSKEFTKAQLDNFILLKKGIENTKLKPRYWHIANSAGIINYPGSHLNSVRPGLILYGADPFAEELKEPDESWQPVLSLVSRISIIRRLPGGSSISYGRKTVLSRASKVGIVPIGYADGLPQTTPPGFHFLVRGNWASLLGRVTMDLIVIDLTDVPSAKPGDEVILVGTQGELAIRPEALALASGRITYEFFTNLGGRLVREYIGG